MGEVGESSSSGSGSAECTITSTRSVGSQSSTNRPYARVAPTAKSLIFFDACRSRHRLRGAGPRRLERRAPVLLRDSLVERAIRLPQEVAHALEAVAQ